jgi:hypothetical protein
MHYYVGKDTMDSNVFSIVVKCWHDTLTGTTHLQVVRTDTAQEVLLGNSTFLLRIPVDGMGTVERCYIRHIASGREAYVQGGPGLRDFIKTCLLNGGSPETGNPGVVGDNETTT